MPDTRSTRSRVLPRAALAGALAFAALPAAMAQTWVLFDDFSAGGLSSTKWSGEEGRIGGGIREESNRSVVSGQLRMQLRSLGDNLRNEGTSVGRETVQFMKSSAITAMKATITMRSVSVGACAAGSLTNSVSAGRARMFGFFFNAGTPQLGSLMNDVFAGVQVVRRSNSTDASGIMRVAGFIGICTDDVCYNSKDLGGIDMGTVGLNTPVTVSLAWNPASNNFTFTRDSSSYTVPYTVSDAVAPATNAKRLDIHNVMMQCAGSRVTVSTMADFDNVYTNQLPTAAALTVPDVSALPEHGEPMN